MTETDAEIRYWNSLPRCIWCSDALPVNERQECGKCGALACLDHCSTLLNGDVICRECQDARLEVIRKFATGENATDLLEGIA